MKEKELKEEELKNVNGGIKIVVNDDNLEELSRNLNFRVVGIPL